MKSRMAALGGVLLAVAMVCAQSGGDYALVWSTVNGGGGTIAGGRYAVIGTIGQPDSGWSQGGRYEVLGGFFPGVPPCIVEFQDFARFAELWLVSGSAAQAEGFTPMGLSDLSWFADYWLSYCPHGWPLK